MWMKEERWNFDKKRWFLKEYRFHKRNLKKLEEEKIRVLTNKWKEEKSEMPSLRFIIFIYAYGNHIYTKNILKGVYENTDLKSKFSTWFNKYRKNHYIELYTEDDINSKKATN